MLAGTATSLVASAGAILRSSQVRPGTLLRGDRQEPGQLTPRYPWGVYALLVVFFGGLASLVVGSLQLGVAVVAGSLIGLG